ncbi:MAG: hypothetical protein ACRC4M_04635 [Mycoplasma sp.]
MYSISFDISSTKIGIAVSINYYNLKEMTILPYSYNTKQPLLLLEKYDFITNFNIENLFLNGFIATTISSNKKKTKLNMLVELIENFRLLFNDKIFLFKDCTIIYETPKAPFAGSKAFGNQKEFLGIFQTIVSNFLLDQNIPIPTIVEIQANQWQKFYPKNIDNIHNSKDKMTHKQKKEWTKKLIKYYFNIEINSDDASDAILFSLFHKSFKMFIV